MSEEHVEEQSSVREGTGRQRRMRRSEVAESKIESGVVSFTFKDGNTVSCEVAKLPPEVQFRYAVEGVRTAGRLSFQKMEDPQMAAAALQMRFDKMLSGQTGGDARRRSTKPVDDLTQALMNMYNKPKEWVENDYIPTYFASASSGCTTNVVGGKTRVYGKARALVWLRAQPRVRAELDKISKARSAEVNKTNQIDLDALAAA